jgi:uncharacterized protein (DUF927 family)
MSRQYRHIHTKQNLYRNDGDSVESKTQPVTRSHFSRVEILMKIPDTLWERAMTEIAHLEPHVQERYVKHFIRDDKHADERLKVVVGDTTTAHFGLSAEALAKLEELK